MKSTFFEQQANARRKTRMLTLYMSLAVIGIVVAVNGLIYLSIAMIDTLGSITPKEWVLSPICWGTTAVTLAVIFGGSLARLWKLRQHGGDAVAAMAGARFVSSDTQNPLEKKLLNVAEEMAIASGTHVPRVYIMGEEAGINAFVAGYNVNNTILAVTQGALENLTRDELQGVIAHEYSHILNADTRINMHLMALLAGLLLIGQIGESLLRSGTRRRYGYGYSSSRRHGNSQGHLILGLGLMAVGYIGLFFGRLIKAAISRQREFLADASSVQFTRNPFGIGAALFKIGQLTQGSHLLSDHAEELSHMCFGATLKVSFSKALATHPPISERLEAIDPSLPARMRSRLRSGELKMGQQVEQATSTNTPAVTSAVSELTSATASFAAISHADTTTTPITPAAIKASVGQLNEQHIQAAQKLHTQIPEALQDIAHEPKRAESLLYGLILTTMNTHGKEAMALLKEKRHEHCAKQTREVYGLFRQHPEDIRLPLLDIALNTLQSLSDKEKSMIVVVSRALIDLDERFTLYEFIYLSLIEKYLRKRGNASTIRSFRAVEPAIAVMLAAITLSGNDSKNRHSQNNTEQTPEQMQQIFRQTLAGFTSKDFSQLLNKPPGVKTLQKATEQLARLTPLLKQPLIDACVDCITHDQNITNNELHLLRALCERLDCPMPLLSI